MPRFGTKTLLFAFILFALWFSTFSGYAAGSDVRASVLLVVLFAAGYAAVYGRGRQRAFWSGFALVMVLTGGNFSHGALIKYIPNFYWRTIQSSQVTIQYGPPPVYAAPVLPTPVPADPAPQPYTPTPAPPIPATAVPVYVPATTVTNPHFAVALNATIELAWKLGLASIVGLIGVWTYSVARRDAPPS